MGPVKSRPVTRLKSLSAFRWLHLAALMYRHMPGLHDITCGHGYKSLKYKSDRRQPVNSRVRCRMSQTEWPWFSSSPGLLLHATSHSVSCLSCLKFDCPYQIKAPPQKIIITSRVLIHNLSGWCNTRFITSSLHYCFEHLNTQWWKPSVSQGVLSPHRLRNRGSHKNPDIRHHGL